MFIIRDIFTDTDRISPVKIKIFIPENIVVFVSNFDIVLVKEERYRFRVNSVLFELRVSVFTHLFGR